MREWSEKTTVPVRTTSPRLVWALDNLWRWPNQNDEVEEAMTRIDGRRLLRHRCRDLQSQDWLPAEALAVQYAAVLRLGGCVSHRSDGGWSQPPGRGPLEYGEPGHCQQRGARGGSKDSKSRPGWRFSEMERGIPTRLSNQEMKSLPGGHGSEITTSPGRKKGTFPQQPAAGDAYPLTPGPVLV